MKSAIPPAVLADKVLGPKRPLRLTIALANPSGRYFDGMRFLALVRG